MTSIPTNEEIAELMQEAGGAVSALLLRDEGEFAETIAKLVLALESLSRERDWKLIDDGAKDGRPILVLAHGADEVVMIAAKYIPGVGQFCWEHTSGGDHWSALFITHYRELPPPPKIKEAKDSEG